MKTKRLFLIGLMLAFAGISHAADMLKVQGAEVAPGENVTLSIELDNETTNLMGWQCDIVLPEGLSLALKNNGKPIAVLGERFATTEHSISSSRLANGAYRFIATSMDGEAIPGTSGTLFTVTLVADASLAERAGTGPTMTGTVKNIEFNTQDNHKLALADVTISVGITATEPQKCATPTISFANGELEFSCETEGVEYEYEVTVADAKKDKGKKVSLTGNYQVSVYATKEGYENSDVATLEFSMSDTGLKGDVNGDGVVDVSDYIGVANLILFGTIDGK